MLWTDDVDNIDPGITYYQMGYMVSYATQRPLYSWKPDDGETAVPDLAESDPQISARRQDRHREDPRRGAASRRP